MRNWQITNTLLNAAKIALLISAISCSFTCKTVIFPWQTREWPSRVCKFSEALWLPMEVQLPTNRIELWHDKTNKMSVRPAKTQISLSIRPVWSESSLCTQYVAKDTSLLHADSEDWSDWADAQADLIFTGCIAILLVLSCCSSVMCLNMTESMLKGCAQIHMIFASGFFSLYLHSKLRIVCYLNNGKLRDSDFIYLGKLIICVSLSLTLQILCYKLPYNRYIQLQLWCSLPLPVWNINDWDLAKLNYFASWPNFFSYCT